MIERPFISLNATSRPAEGQAFFRCVLFFGALLCGSLLSTGMLANTAQAGPSLPHHGSHIQGTYPQVPSDDALASEDTPSDMAQSSPDLQCPLAERHYRKSLLITAFPRREPSAGKGGGLPHAEQELPKLVGEQLSQSGQLWRYQQLSQSLPRVGLEPARRAQQVRQLAQQTDTQLVLTGELLDMGLTRTNDVHAPGLVTRGRNNLVSGLRLNPDWDTRQREFVLNLQLLNGITGEPVFERQYRTQGVWNPRKPNQTGFGSPSFWETHYGEQIALTLKQATNELSEAVRCQQLASRLAPQQRGQSLMLHSGATQGLQVGDRLPLYQVVHRSIPGLYRQYSAHLVDSGQRVTVMEAHRDHSMVRLESDRPLSGAHVALTPETNIETGAELNHESISQR